MPPGFVNRLLLRYSSTSCLSRRSVLLPEQIIKRIRPHQPLHPDRLSYSTVIPSFTIRLKSTTTASSPSSKDGFEDLDKPIKFTTSKAASWKATDSLGGGPDDMPNAQPLIIVSSVGAFLIYFLYLREENDIDEMMKQPLWDRIPGLERQQLEMLIQYNKERGLPSKELEDRLEIVRKKEAANKGNVQLSK